MIAGRTLGSTEAEDAYNAFACSCTDRSLPMTPSARMSSARSCLVSSLSPVRGLHPNSTKAGPTRSCTSASRCGRSASSIMRLTLERAEDDFPDVFVPIVAKASSQSEIIRQRHHARDCRGPGASLTRLNRSIGAKPPGTSRRAAQKIRGVSVDRENPCPPSFNRRTASGRQGEVHALLAEQDTPNLRMAVHNDFELNPNCHCSADCAVDSREDADR